MANLAHIDTLESLTKHFNAVTKDLLRIDGVSLYQEVSRLNPIKERLDTLTIEPDPELFSCTKELVSSLQDYVEEKGLRFNDGLTKIPNRSGFEAQLEKAVKRNGSSVGKKRNPDATMGDERKHTFDPNAKNYSALLFLDLDRFKGLNDTYGHQAGDAALQKFAQIISTVTRKGDVSAYVSSHSKRARLGGDEFAIIINAEASNFEEAREQLENALLRVRKELAVQFSEYQGVTFPLVSSCGMHVIEEGDTPETVMKKADAALYKHKTEPDENGRSKAERYNYCVDQLKEQSVANLQTFQDNRALEEDIKRRMELGTSVDNIIKEDALQELVFKNGSVVSEEDLALLARHRVPYRFAEPEDNIPG